MSQRLIEIRSAFVLKVYIYIFQLMIFTGLTFIGGHQYFILYSACIYIYTYIHIYKYIYVCIYIHAVYIYMYMYIHVYIYIYIIKCCIYIYIYLLLNTVYTTCTVYVQNIICTVRCIEFSK